MSELAVVTETPPSAPVEASPERVRPTLQEWAQANWRKLIWAIILLLIPYFLTCYALTAVMLRGSCG